MMDGGMMGGMAAWVALWGLLAMALIVLAVVGTVWLVRSMRDNDASAPRSVDAARRRLDERYAAGDLSRDEYLQRRDDLSAV